jgi:glycosyltransferase involved in cell wall biosynthesis
MSCTAHSADQRCRSVHVIAGLSSAHGGPSYTVPRLCRALSSVGAEATVFSVAEPDQRDIHSNGSHDICFPQDFAHVPIMRRLRFSRGLTHALTENGSKLDIIHNHGLWLMPNVMAGRIAQRSGKPFILAPEGMLSDVALGFSRRKKRLFWDLWQGQVARSASCVHVMSEQEHDEVREFGLENPIAIIPNGIDLPELEVQLDPRPEVSRVVLSLGRIHPKKGLDRLVRAWALIEKAHPAWWLRIVGPDELNHSAELKALVLELKIERVAIEPAITGRSKLIAYQQADIFVLPTLNENFAITVAESLAAETPVIATKGAPWRALETEGCGWWIDHSIDSLAATLTAAMAMTREELKKMGAKGRAWMARDFSWDRIARDTLELYRWLFVGGEPPNTVRLK